jgi:hypothetical protein
MLVGNTTAGIRVEAINAIITNTHGPASDNLIIMKDAVYFITTISILCQANIMKVTAHTIRNY